MTQPTTFGQNATIHCRRLIDALHDCKQDLEEYQAMGGSVWSTASGDFTKAQIDNLMGAINTLDATFEANAGYFYEGAQ